MRFPKFTAERVLYQVSNGYQTVGINVSDSDGVYPAQSVGVPNPIDYIPPGEIPELPPVRPVCVPVCVPTDFKKICWHHPLFGETCFWVPGGQKCHWICQ
jgi:hypothetical protein